jgi:hypothetical protein
LSAEDAGKVKGESSTEEMVERLRESLSGYDGTGLAERINEFSIMMMAVFKDNPELAAEAFPAIEAAFTGTDFGKLREAVTALLGYGAAGASKALEQVLVNPVVVANLVGMLPPVINGVLEVLAALVDNLDLPPEILASALFNVLSAIDAETLGHDLSGISRQVILLHAGNYILGGDEPRFRAVFTDFMERLLDNLDRDAASHALVALLEDAEVAAAVLVDIVSRDPRAIDTVAWTLVELTNVATRVVSNMLDRAAAWPEESLAILGKEGRVLDTAEMGRALNSFVTYALRLREANPGLHREIYTHALEPVDPESLEVHLRAVAGDLVSAATDHPGISKALEPEEVGRRVNEALAGFNSVAAPGAVSDYLKRMFSAIDPGELEAAIKTLGGGLVDALFATARTGRSVLRAAASTAWKLTKNLFSLPMKKT